MSAYLLPGRLTVVTAAACRQELLAHIQQSAGDVEVAGEAVEHIDAAGIQLLLATARTLAGSGRRLVLSSRSQPLEQALLLCGLVGRFAGAEVPAHAP